MRKMKKEEIDKFFDKYGIEKAKEIEPKYPRNWENPPIPHGMRLVFECY